MPLARDNLYYEVLAYHLGFTLVAGIDEAGRGPLAGPVVAAAVILPKEIALEGVTDSKKMSEKAREGAFLRIHKRAIDISVATVGPQEIDQINILQATLKAMKEAVGNLHPQPNYLLIDGTGHIDLPIHQRCLVKGDEISLSISAASIVAKVYRDRIMKSLHAPFPQYGFASNKGYGTQEHKAALERYGPCRMHRLSFKGVVT